MGVLDEIFDEPAYGPDGLVGDQLIGDGGAPAGPDMPGSGGAAEDVQFGADFEAKHPREADGTFAEKVGGGHAGHHPSQQMGPDMSPATRRAKVAWAKAHPGDRSKIKGTNEWIEAVLANDEASSDEELLDYFIDNGLHPEYAAALVKSRDEILKGGLAGSLDSELAAAHPAPDPREPDYHSLPKAGAKKREWSESGGAEDLDRAVANYGKEEGETARAESHAGKPGFQTMTEVQVERANTIREGQGLPATEWERDVLPLSWIKPSQAGEDYLNESSRHLAKHIGTFDSSGRDPGDEEDSRGVNLDYAPIAVDEDWNIIDGNHRHAARSIAGHQYVDVIRPKGSGSSRLFKRGGNETLPEAPGAKREVIEDSRGVPRSVKKPKGKAKKAAPPEEPKEKPAPGMLFGLKADEAQRERIAKAAKDLGPFDPVTKRLERLVKKN